MTEAAAPGRAAPWPGAPGGTAWAAWCPPDRRRRLQLALGALWLLDAILQYQAVMFTSAFGRMLAATAPGNPAVLAQPIIGNATLVERHSVALNAVFATVQLLLALGIAWRPTARAALGASIAWALGVWWFGEGFGGVLSGTASPINGAPGPVILYALLAVLLWPRDPPAPAPFVAAQAVGARTARALWLVLWGSLAYLALLPANRAPQALHDMIAGQTAGEPGWLAATGTTAAGLLAHHGLLASVLLALLLAVAAVAPGLPPPAARATLILAITLAMAIWVVGQALGGVLTGGGTDPGSGPLLALLAVAYWPTRAQPAQAQPAQAQPAQAQPARAQPAQPGLAGPPAGGG